MFCTTVQADSVESQNIVGYTTISVKAGTKDIKGAPFVNAGGSTFNIQNISLSNGTDGSDWIMVFDASTKTYATYYWFEEVYSDATYETSLGKPGWGNEYYIIEKELDPGQGFWIRTGNDCDVTLPGQVLAASDNSFEVSSGVKDIVACVYPTSLDIQDITLSAGTDGSDWIMVFDADSKKYNTYYWFEEIYTDSTYETSLGKAGWGNEYYVLPCEIEPGQGFWIRTGNNCTVTFPSPL